MLRLYNWFLTKSDGWNNAWGIVEGHDRLYDGLFVHTSELQSIDLDEENKCLILLTYSQNRYYLYFKDICLDRIEETKEVLGVFHIPDSSLSECDALKKKDTEQLIEKADSVLGFNELLLSVLLKRAFYKDEEGVVNELGVDTHVGTFQDSVLVLDYENHKVDFRYFPRGFSEDVIEPYHWSDGLNAVVIENNTRNKIKFIGTSKHIYCPSGELTKISSDVYSGEGLFSPDTVNGKSILH